jgi:Transposase DDE domain
LEFDTTAAGRVGAGTAVVKATSARLLWQALDGVYQALGFTVVRDETFRALVLARIVEPTSKLDTVRVLGELGVDSPSRVTFVRCLKRSADRDYRELISQACFGHATRAARLGLVLYDVTTLYFETPREDTLRKVGMSKERRVDPQVTVGLLTDGMGFPLAVHLFEGNKAETKTLIPVLTGFRDAHPDAAEIIVVADAGMLSAGNLLALEQAGFRFIVGSKISNAPYNLAAHLERHGNAFDDGQTIETARTMGTGKAARSRRVVYQWRFARYRHDIQAINAMIERAEAVAAGRRPVGAAARQPEIHCRWACVPRISGGLEVMILGLTCEDASRHASEACL